MGAAGVADPAPAAAEIAEPLHLCGPTRRRELGHAINDIKFDVPLARTFYRGHKKGPH